MMLRQVIWLNSLNKYQCERAVCRVYSVTSELMSSTLSRFSSTFSSFALVSIQFSHRVNFIVRTAAFGSNPNSDEQRQWCCTSTVRSRRTNMDDDGAELTSWQLVMFHSFYLSRMILNTKWERTDPPNGGRCRDGGKLIDSTAARHRKMTQNANERFFSRFVRLQADTRHM